MHIIMPSFGDREGGGLFKVSVTRGIVVLFFVSTAAVLLQRKVSFRTFCMFPSNSVLFCGMIISVAGCRQSSFPYYVEFCRVETNLYRRVLSRECCL